MPKALVLRGERAPQRKDPTYKEFVAAIGGRAGLRDIVLHSSNPKAADLLKLMDDSAYNRMGVKALAHKADISYFELTRMRDERSRNLAVSNLVAGLPALAEDLKKDAASKEEGCPICFMEKVLQFGEDPATGEPIFKKCWKCLGSGVILVPGDKDARSLIAKTTKLVEEVGTTVIAGDINQTQINFGDSFEEQMKRAGKAIAAASKPITVTATPASNPAGAETAEEDLPKGGSEGA
jgi:hypothetical protein